MQEENMSTPEVVDVDDLNHFFNLLSGWHENRVDRLEHLLEIPEGTEITLESGDVLELNGAVLDAFKIGVTVALMELGTLPFVSEDVPDGAVAH